MADHDKTVEQLWYTWSDVGLDTIRAGFRIRAASEGLKDIRSVRMQSLDRYQRYFLPRDSDHSTVSPSIAPICLSLINTGEERILVHKAYTGKDGIGRYGAFFIHLLADIGLPEEFSAMDAILLWRSDFWQDSDVTLLDHRNTILGRPSLEELKTKRKRIALNPQHITKFQKDLYYLIQAYLIKKLFRDENTGQTVPQKLYIAAPDDKIAQLILGLTYCLPEQLWKNLTFSTYEPDVTEATTEIVGTCWLSVPEPEKDPLVKHLLAQLLPDEYYVEKLAINCYTEIYPPLENNPLIIQCANDATEYFILKYIVQPGTGFGKLKESDKRKIVEKLTKFQDLLETARVDPNLDVKEFLNLYESMIVRAEDPSDPNIDSAIMPRSQSNLIYSSKMLSSRGYQRGLINRVLRDPNWWGAVGRAAITNLRVRSTNVPILAQALSQIAHCAIPNAINIVREGVSPTRATRTAEVIAQEAATFKIIVDLMVCVAPPKEDSQVWFSFLWELVTIKHLFTFFRQHWDIYAELMQLWASILPLSKENYKRIQPLLPLSWADWGDFLALGLPLVWNERITNSLLSHSALSEEIALMLKLKYHPLIEDLLRQLSQDRQWWSTAGNLFGRLVAAKYGKIWPLLIILLDSPMGQPETHSERLLKIARLTVEEQLLFLKRYGLQYLPLSNKMSRAVLEMFDELVRSDIHKEKMSVLFSWLETPQLFPWFDSLSMGKKNLEMVLEIAHLDTEESGEFFKRFGQKYITLYPDSSTLLKLFSSYAQTGTKWRLHLLDIWLGLQVDQKTLEQVLQAANLTANERKTFLEYYGEIYISRYVQSQGSLNRRIVLQSQLFLNYIWEYQNYLWTADIDIFQGRSSPEEPSPTERFLCFLCNFSEHIPSQQLRCDWCTWCHVGVFVRKPSTIKEWKEVAQSVGALLNKPDVPKETSTKLITKLALACIEDENGLLSAINIFRDVLTRRNLVLVLYQIAESAREGIRQGQYAKPLFVSCIQFAFSFKVFFNEKDKQEYFVQIFLNTLLQDMDKKTFDWLNAKAKKWPSDVYSEWRYESQRLSSLAVVELTRIERIKLWRERTVAFMRLRKALRSEKIRQIIQVTTNYMTTLISYDKEVQDEWWYDIDKALTSLKANKMIQWQWYKSERNLKHIAPPPAEKRAERIKLWWERTVVFMRMRLALRSKKIGRIVRVATDHMVTLVTYDKEVPGKWWTQIDVAFDFFMACEGADESTDESREKAIISATNAIDDLVVAGHPAPRLTAHEKRRYHDAIQYVTTHDAQSKSLNNIHQMLSTLLPVPMPGTGQAHLL